jgi:uncharacterized membrane protein YraQ (UPF0718 family)
MEIGLAALDQVWETFREIWPYLLISVLVAAAMRRYVDLQHVSRWLQKYHTASIFASTSVAVSTPLCSCGGSLAVALSMMAASLPWGPLVAFIIASPLTSPDEVLYSAGLFGWPFALTYFTAAVSAGVAGGFLAHAMERKGWLANQVRFKPEPGGKCCRTAPKPEEKPCCITTEDMVAPMSEVSRTRSAVVAYGREVVVMSRRLLLIFTLASFLGYLLSDLVPAAWIRVLFGSGKGWSVPFAAALGIPFYLNTSSSLPIVRAFIQHGASPGAAMAFLLVGAGTSVGAIAGLLTIARWRVVALVIVTLWPVAIIFGYVYDAMIAMKLF